MGAVFSGIVPVQTRLNMIHKLVKVFLEGEDQVAYQALRRDVETMAKRRNVIIHGFWTIRDEEADTIFLKEKFPLAMAEAEPVPYTHETFIGVQHQLENQRGDATRFRKHVGESRAGTTFSAFLLAKLIEGTPTRNDQIVSLLAWTYSAVWVSLEPALS
jgi:hypothetical protein